MEEPANPEIKFATVDELVAELKTRCKVLFVGMVTNDNTTHGWTRGCFTAGETYEVLGLVEHCRIEMIQHLDEKLQENEDGEV